MEKNWNSVVENGDAQTTQSFEKTDYTKALGQTNLEKRPRKKWNLRDIGCGIIHARLFARFPVLMCLFQLGLIGFCTGLTVYFYGVPSFDNAIKGLEARGTPIHDRIIAHEVLHRESTVFSPTPSVQLPSSSIDLPVAAGNESTTSAPRMANLSESVSAGISRCGNPSGNSFQVVYGPSSKVTDLFNASALRSMCFHDDVFIRSSQTFQNVCNNGSYIECCPTWSLPNYVAALANRTSCYNLTDADVSYARTLLLQCAPYYTSGQLRSDCGSGANCTSVPDNCTELNAVYVIFFALTPSTYASQIRDQGDVSLTTSLQIASLTGAETEAKDVYLDTVGRKFIDDGVTHIKAIGTHRFVKFLVLTDILVFDLIYAGAGTVIVTILMWVYFGSIFIAIMVLFEIGFSLCLAFFFYHTVCRLSFFHFGNTLALVLVLGVGVDDAFIFFDIFKKKRADSPDENRVSILQETMRDAFPTMFVTSLTTSMALLANATSSVTAVRLYAVYGGLVILCNFLFTMTWSPATAMIYDRYISRLELNFPDDNSQTMMNSCRHCLKRFWGKLTNCYRVFFSKWLPLFVIKLRFLWLVVFTGLAIASTLVVFWNPQLRLPELITEFQLFTTRHPLELYDQEFRFQFGIEQSKLQPLPIIVSWGTVATDNGDHWDPDSRGFVQLDDSFDFTQPESQVWLVNFCSKVRQQRFYKPPTAFGEYCFIESMKLFMDAPCVPSSLGLDLSPCCNQQTFPYSPSLFHTCAAKYAALRCSTNVEACLPGSPGLRFGPNDTISAFWILFESSAIAQLDYGPSKEFYDTALAWVQEEIKTAPPGLQNGFFGTLSDPQPYFIDLLINLSNDTPLAIGLSLLIATVVLLITNKNIVIAVYAVLSISGAIVTSVAVFVLLGWQINIFECALIVLAVGLATDFTIHYGVAYRTAPHTDRKSRAFHAISTLSSPNSLAAFSSFVIGAFMLPSTVLIFVQLGIALEIVMVCSWSFGTFFFISLCHVAGPQGKFDQLRFCCKSKSEQQSKKDANQ